MAGPRQACRTLGRSCSTKAGQRVYFERSGGTRVGPSSYSECFDGTRLSKSSHFECSGGDGARQSSHVERFGRVGACPGVVGSRVPSLGAKLILDFLGVCVVED